MLNQIETDRGMIVYVTIGVPFSSIPIMQKVMLFVDLEKETHVAAAKRLRKMVADNIQDYGWVPGSEFTPAELYYEIYGTISAIKPIFASANAPCFKEKELSHGSTIAGAPEG
jgi:hypothetical protein